MMKCLCCGNETSNPVYDPVNKCLIFNGVEYPMRGRLFGIFSILYENFGENVKRTNILEKLNCAPKSFQSELCVLKNILKDSPFKIIHGVTFEPLIRMELK